MQAQFALLDILPLDLNQIVKWLGIQGDIPQNALYISIHCLTHSEKVAEKYLEPVWFSVVQSD